MSLFAYYIKLTCDSDKQDFRPTTIAQSYGKGGEFYGVPFVGVVSSTAPSDESLDEQVTSTRTRQK